MSKPKPYAVPPKFIEAFAYCKDSKNPPEGVQDWIEENKIYKVLGIRKSLNHSEETSVIIADKEGIEMQPTRSMGGYKGSRFELIQIYIN